jgi:hypothetical protein
LSVNQGVALLRSRRHLCGGRGSRQLAESCDRSTVANRPVAILALERHAEGRLSLFVVHVQFRAVCHHEADDAFARRAVQCRVAGVVERIDVEALLETELDRLDRVGLVPLSWENS